VAVFVISFALLFFQVSVSRLLSLLTWYHFSVLPITCAMLGLGAAGAAGHLFRRHLSGPRVEVVCALLSYSLAISIPIMLSILFSWPITLVGSQGISAIGQMFAVFALVLCPLFLGGMVLTIIFHTEEISFARLYGIDFLGAAAGSLAVFLMLTRLSTPTALLVVAAALLLVPLAYSIYLRLRALCGLTVLTLVVMTFLIFQNDAHRYVYPVYSKSTRIDDKAWTGWNSISHVSARTFYGGGNEHGLSLAYPRKPRNYVDIVIDGSAGTTTNLFTNDEDFSEFSAQFDHDMFYAAHQLVSAREQLAIIGTGAGMDVLAAKRLGFKRVDAVELNPLVIRTLRENAPDTFDRTYHAPGVKLLIEEGRDFVRRSPQKYDLVQLVMVDTFAASASGALALSENHLYTLEAFQEFLNALNENGMLTVVRWAQEAPRLVNLGAAALESIGVANPRDHLALFYNKRGHLESVNLVLSRKPFSARQTKTLQTLAESFPLLCGPAIPSRAAENWPSDLAIISRGGYQRTGEIRVGVTSRPLRERGYTVAVLDKEGKNITELYTFDTCEDPRASDRLAQAVSTIPHGRIALIAAVDDASANLKPAAVNALGSLGLVGDLRGKFAFAHAAIGRKGLPPGKAMESGPIPVDATADASSSEATANFEARNRALLVPLLDPAQRKAYADSLPADISPPVDDRPFYFLNTRAVTLASPFNSKGFFGLVLGADSGAMLAWLNVLVLAAVAAIIVIPLFAGHREREPKPSAARLAMGILYFTCIGLGFMWVEILLLQKFILFLGHPVYSMTTILFSLLLGSGLGSLAGGSARFRFLAPIPVLFVIVFYIFAVTVWLTPLLYQYMSWPAYQKVIISVLVIAPGGFFLGMPLPLGRRLLEQSRYAQFCWYWGANGAASVLGASSSLLLATRFGYTTVGFVAVGVYVLAMLSAVVATRLPDRQLVARLR
jgi:spermidine synthase